MKSKGESYPLLVTGCKNIINNLDKILQAVLYQLVKQIQLQKRSMRLSISTNSDFEFIQKT